MSRAPFSTPAQKIPSVAPPSVHHHVSCRRDLSSTLATRVSGAGTLLRIAIRRMWCQARHPPPPPRSCLFEKTRIPSPRRQQPVYQGPDAPCRSPPVRLRPSQWRPSRPAASRKAVRAEAVRCDGRSRTGRLPRGLEIPGRAVAVGEGTASEFCGTGYLLRSADVRHCTIHPIAIRMSRPWLDGRVPGGAGPAILFRNRTNVLMLDGGRGAD
jgi:hypothetical protein